VKPAMEWGIRRRRRLTMSKSLDLWETVIVQIKADFENRDETAVFEMLKSIPQENLIAFLPEEKQFSFLQAERGKK